VAIAARAPYRQESASDPRRRVEPCGHLVDGLRQAAELVFPRFVSPMVEASLSKVRGGPLQLIDGTSHPAQERNPAERSDSNA
jgi:hypothetical protein